MIRINSAQYLNQLALSSLKHEQQQQARNLIQINRFKLKSINQLAKNDPNFTPYIPSTKTSTSPTLNTLYTNIHGQNPESQSVKLGLKRTQLRQVRNEFGYCFDCDQSYDVCSSHGCKGRLMSQASVNERIRQLCIDANEAKCDKFTILLDTAYNFKQSQPLLSLISLLKSTNVHYTPKQMHIRLRLINLCSKKIGLLLQKQEEYQ